MSTFYPSVVKRVMSETKGRTGSLYSRPLSPIHIKHMQKPSACLSDSTVAEEVTALKLVLLQCPLHISKINTIYKTPKVERQIQMVQYVPAAVLICFRPNLH